MLRLSAGPHVMPGSSGGDSPSPGLCNYRLGCLPGTGASPESRWGSSASAEAGSSEVTCGVSLAGFESQPYRLLAL